MNALLKRLEKESARAIAPFFKKVDAPVYAEAGRDPHCPLLFGGNPEAKVAFFGRDPGRDEIKQWQPLIGISGLRTRKAFLRDTALSKPEIIAESLRRGFYFNTVPYKPLGNKAWEPEVIAAFRDIVTLLITDVWQGDTLFTLGTEAFQWFLDIADAPASHRTGWSAYWTSADRYRKSLSLTLASGGRKKKLRIIPLPHPSPLNRRWYDEFPKLMGAHLQGL